MPNVVVQETLNCPVSEAWKLVTDIESYPEKMPSVKSVTVKNKNNNEWVSEWVVSLRDSEMQWTEKEVHLPHENRVEFSQLEGDLEAFSGFWELKEQSLNETLVTLSIDFAIGIPALDDILNPVAVEALRENSEMMLRTLNTHSSAPN